MMKPLILLATLCVGIAAAVFAQSNSTPVFGVATYAAQDTQNGQVSFDDATDAKPGDLVTLVFIDPGSQNLAIRQDQLGDAITETDTPGFLLPPSPALTGRAGLAILGNISALDLSDGTLTLRFTDGSDPAVLTTCQTTEGLQLNLTEGKVDLWEGYAALGYDVEPTCEKSP